MIIEHDGKTIDTEREIRHRLCHTPARYVGRLRNGGLIFEWGDSCWDVHSAERAVMKFENVPPTHERFINIYDDNSCGAVLLTKELADANAETMAHTKRRIDCIRITWQN